MNARNDAERWRAAHDKALDVTHRFPNHSHVFAEGRAIRCHSIISIQHSLFSHASKLLRSLNKARRGRKLKMHVEALARRSSARLGRLRANNFNLTSNV